MTLKMRLKMKSRSPRYNIDRPRYNIDRPRYNIDRPRYNIDRPTILVIILWNFTMF